MVAIHPIHIQGRWQDGFALDLHTVSSTYIGDDEFGHPQFDNRRSAIGDLLYRFKYNSDSSVEKELAETAAHFIRKWSPGIDLIVPVPPSRSRRSRPPVLVLAELICNQIGVELGNNCITKCKMTAELKNVLDYDQRLKLLDGAFRVCASRVDGRRVLLFDDLYRSGATMNAVATALYDEAKVSAVFALALTRTRGNR